MHCAAKVAPSDATIVTHQPAGVFEKLPKTARTLLGTQKVVQLQNMAGGSYYHFGFLNGLKEKFNRFPLLAVLKKPAKYLFSTDGIPLTKSSSSTFWPILALEEGESTPFPIGVFHGHSKPTNFDEFLKPFVIEVNQIAANGGVDIQLPAGESYTVPVVVKTLQLTIRLQQRL